MNPVWDLATAVTAAGRRSPRHTAVVSIREGLSATYSTLDERSDRIANGLLGLGLLSGDRIALWMETSLAHVLLYLAAAKSRLVVVPVNEQYLAGEAAHVLRDSGARALLYGSFAASMVEELGLDDGPVLVHAGEGVPGSMPL